jgi:hypothetical protein
MASRQILFRLRCASKGWPAVAALAVAAAAFLVQPGCAPSRPELAPVPREVAWLGFHALVENNEDARALLASIPVLARQGVNLLVAEVDYNFQYASHPELRGPDPISLGTVKQMVGLCRRYGIRLVPEFQSLGHQSWAGKTFALLTRYPQFDETPGQYPGNKDIYCRSWCPLHPDLAPIINQLYDELIDAFEADALHVGMDEVFLIGSEFCPRCRGRDPAELFAKAVRDAYDHIVVRRGKEMFMWADRLLDGAATGYGEWEASMNKTYPAVDMIPKDIVLCDWHYELNATNTYPSIPFFLEKGFRVLPTSFRNSVEVRALINDSLRYPTDKMLGHMCTIWRGVEPGKIRKYRPLLTASRMLRADGPKAAAVKTGNVPPTVRILVNQVGYEPAGSKKAVVEGRAGDTFGSFTVRELATGKAALDGQVCFVGPVEKWKDWVFGMVDFTPVTKEGSYIIEVSTGKGVVTSHPLTIQKNVLERNTLSDVIYYFKGQRSSGPWDKSDRTMRFEGRDGVVDVHGGWFDATGDYGKHLTHLSFSTFFNPQQISLTAWSLFQSLRELERRGDPNFTQYKKRLLDEALFGADYLVRLKNPAGSFYISVSARGPEKKPADRLITPKAIRHIILTAETKDKFRDYGREQNLSEAAYEAGYREGAGLCIAALAMASTCGVSGDFGRSDYLRAAEDAFAFLEKSNVKFLNDGKENILDDACALAAAVELFRATGKPVYREAMDRRARGLEARLITSGRWSNYWRADDGTRPFFHPVDAGLPVVSLLQYSEVAAGPDRARALDAARRSLDFELRLTAEVTNPFGYSRQLVQDKTGARRTSFFFSHNTETEPWWQGENARLASMAAAARLARRYFGEDVEFGRRLEAFSRDQLNWILGLNPYDSCMMQGKGRNNPAYMFFDSYEYTNAPGGIVNGITAGVNDEQDIDFYLHFRETGKDDDWRWAEQWLPHAAWYLYAVALGIG